MSKKSLSVVDVLQRSLAHSFEDVKSILKFLGMSEYDLGQDKSSTRSDAKKIADYLCKMGSNDIATLFRGGNGVPYDEVVYDVAKKLKVPGICENDSPECTERKIIDKLFADAFDQMSNEEKRMLLNSIGLTGAEIPYAATGTLITQLLLKKFGGFAVYRTSLVMANIVSRALLGSGLSFAANATLTRSVGMLLGPIGLTASGAWLAIDLAGPAYRKTVPAIIHIACLRQIVINRLNIGIIGSLSVGKDSLLNSVFGVYSDKVTLSPDAEILPLGNTGTINLINFPGFNDVISYDDYLTDLMQRTDIFLMVLDISARVSDIELKMLNTLKAFEVPILVCLNKIDLVRPKDREGLLQAAKECLGLVEVIETAFNPNQRVYQGSPIGADEVFIWIKRRLEDLGKETDHFVKVIS